MKDIKFVAMVAAGVVVAGIIMKQFRGDIAILEMASDGFDT